MNLEEIENICSERLGGWAKKLSQEHATPVLLLGVGHGHKKGQLVICTTEDMSDRDIQIFLEGALMQLWGVSQIRTCKLGGHSYRQII